MPKRRVAIGLLGTTLDRGTSPARWRRWRPTVDLCRQEALVFDRVELIHEARAATLAARIGEDVHRVSPETEVRSHVTRWRDPWDFEEVYATLHGFARAYPFRPDDEEYFVHITTGTHVMQICLFLLAESRHLPARLIQTSPPSGRDASVPGRHAIIDLDLSRYDRLASRFAQEHREGQSFLKAGIETRSAMFNALIDRIERVAIASTAPVLLSGPTGAGKSQLARRIYQLKRARGQVAGPFVEVNCATLRGDGAISTLFGHVRGAFTGARADRAGLLRAADGGVMFLDEIGELGLDEQAMLLRAIEEKTFLPMGTDREVSSDFQLIAGTNRTLPERVRKGTFRDDLLARINLWTFALPGLAERREDIEPNLDFELAEWTRSTGHRVTINRPARERFLRFAESPDATWAANFRDFNAAVVRMSTLAQGGRITVTQVDDEIERLRGAWEEPATAIDAALARVMAPEAIAQLDRFDRVQLADVLDVCARSPSLSAAGRTLFAASRARKKSSNDADRLRKYLRRFDLDWSEVSG